MSPESRAILDHLEAVEHLRREVADDSGLQRRVFALKAYQARRFERTYADLLAAGSRYRDAALFFLEELYAAKDFHRRDTEFARIVPSVGRIFSDDVVATVATLVSLHATTERLDLTMARLVPSDAIARADYLRAWQRCGQFDQRRQQLAMTIEIGHALDHHTRSLTVRRLLRVMRMPARAAGLGELQRFLERGFETFGRMGGADDFLGLIQGREASMIEALSSRVPASSGDADPKFEPPLDQLP